MHTGVTIHHTLPGRDLDSCIRQFCGHLTGDPFRSWLILPTRRLVRTIKEQLAASDTVFVPDHICTLDGAAATLLSHYGKGVRLIDDPTARIILSDILHQHQEELSIILHHTPSSKTLQDLQTLISVIIRREIQYPECLEELQGEKSEQIASVIRLYRERLHVSSLVDADILLEWACDFLLNLPVGDAEKIFRNIIFYGLFEPLPLEKRFISRILNITRAAEYYLPAGDDPGVFADSKNWTGGTQEICEEKPAQKRNFTGIFCQDTKNTTSPVQGVFLKECADPAEEMRSIAEEITSLHLRGVAYRDIVVAFADLKSALEYAGEIFPDYEIPFHSSSPVPSAGFPLVLFYLQVMELGVNGFRYEDLIRVVQSPYLCFSWQDEREGKPAKKILSYRKLDIICRSYGICKGYTDWRALSGRIQEMAEKGKNPSPKHSVMDASSSQYLPRQPFSVRDITDTLEGTERLVAILKRITGNKSIPEHIRDVKKILRQIGSPVPDCESGENSILCSLSPGEWASMKHFFQMLERIDELDTASLITGTDGPQEIPLSRFLAIVRLCVQNGAWEQDPEENGVLLTGIREIAHQHYPVLFLASLNEGNIPRLTTRLPFTNGTESRKMEARSISDILRQEKYHFISALQAGTGDIYLSYYRHLDDRTHLSSPFLTIMEKGGPIEGWEKAGSTDDIKGESQSLQIQSTEKEPARCSGIAAAQEAGVHIREGRWEEALDCIGEDDTLSLILDRIAIEKTIRAGLNRSSYDGLLSENGMIREELNTRFGAETRWSASQLEIYSQCPFRFFMERVIRIQPLPEPDGDLAPVMKGTLIHNVLCRFLRMMQKEGRLPLKPAFCHDAIHDILLIAEEELSLITNDTPLWEAYRKHLTGDPDIGPGILEGFVAVEGERLEPEKKRNPETYTPSFFEYSFGEEKPYAGQDPSSVQEPVDLSIIARRIITETMLREGEEKDQTPYDPGEIPERVLLTGRIDRIDITDDGKFGVVDYKTGRKKPKISEISEFRALQLPLYIRAFEEISGKTGVFGSYYHISRPASHRFGLFDPRKKETLPRGNNSTKTPEWQRVRDEAVFRSCMYVSRIRRGVFPIQANAPCDPDWYCPYATICRFEPGRGYKHGERIAGTCPGDLWGKSGSDSSVRAEP